MPKDYSLLCGVLLLIIGTSLAQDSLQSALNAVHRRQRSLDLPPYRSYGGYDNYAASYWPEDLDNQQSIDFLDQEDDSSTSSFRERAEKAKTLRDKNKLLHALSDLHQSRQRDDYADLLEKFEGYPADEEPIYPYKQYKRYNYNSLGYNSIGLRKRARYPYPARSDANLEDAEAYLPYGNDYIYKSNVERRVPFYPVTKRFPVTKRSSRPGNENESHMGHTDPKVEQELDEIFAAHQAKPDNPEENKTSTKKPTLLTKTEKPSIVKKENVKETSDEQATTQNTLDTTPQAVQGDKEKPLQMKKKSVSWSDYFGIDRRKKSTSIDNEWLMERYRNANAETAKRASEYPLRNFHKHDAEPTASSGKNAKNADNGITRLDEKLKAIEEAIIDDTLKFTGAHDGVDSKEMQVVKDSIISRLATAYNVEKMRKALGEYRQSLERRQNEWDAADDGEESNEASYVQEKRVAVARKQAVDDDHSLKDDDEDNNIKCTHADDENCNEQNYKVPKEFIEQATLEKGCEKIERACKEVAVMFGTYGNVFETACNMHQMCMLCSDNSWFSPTRQCNILFLAKADQLCDGDINCQRGGRESIKYLQHVNRSMRSDLSACHLECPDKR